MQVEKSVSKTIFVDTLYVIALVNERDQYHQQAIELAAKLVDQPLLTTDAVLLEIGNGLARNYKQAAIEVLEEFLASEDVTIVHLTPELFDQAFSLYKKYQDKSWGLIDCISFEVMRATGVNQALTSDQHFEQAGFRVLL
jgi:predicted nucleic acid-binding protein